MNQEIYEAIRDLIEKEYKGDYDELAKTIAEAVPDVDELHNFIEDFVMNASYQQLIGKDLAKAIQNKLLANLRRKK